MKTKMKSVVRRFYQPVCLVQNAVEQVNFTGKWLVMPAMGGRVLYGIGALWSVQQWVDLCCGFERNGFLSAM